MSRRGTPALSGSNQNSQHEDENEGRPSGAFLALPTSPSNPDLQVSGDANSTSTSNHVSSSERKESERQFKLNGILLILAFFHFLATLLGNIAFLLGTVYQSAWMKFDGR